MMTARACWVIHDPSEPVSSTSPKESLLVFSDVHLGNDLNDRKTGAPIQRSHRIDADLVLLLRHYASAKPAGERWRIVIAGDFIDFIGMAVGTTDATVELTSEEHAHGLGNASEHTRIKLRKVSERHADVFDALAAFVAKGHALTVVHGNHDLEFHWDDVKADFRQILLGHATRGETPIAEDEFLARIEFNPWFFYWNGVAYIEHGHQYDTYCATEHIMTPLSAADPRRVARGFCDTLLRFVVRPTSGLREHGHEHQGIADYIAFGSKLGLRGMFSLLMRFIRAVLELFRLRREHFSDAAEILRKEHERRKALFAEATRISIDRIVALAALQVPPLTSSIRGILASLLLDRLALGIMAFMLVVACAILGVHRGHFFYAGISVLIAWAVGHRYLSRQRNIDPTEALTERASQLATLLPAAFVVMGHTHVPAEIPINRGESTYINLGSWAEEEPTADATDHYRAARTHLVIHMEDGKPHAELLAWDSTAGPRAFRTRV